MKNYREELNELTYRLLNDIEELPPFDFRDKFKGDYEDESDLIFDLPYTYTSDNNGHLIIHQVIVGKNEDGDLICYGTGEDWGEIEYKSLSDVPVETLVEVYNLITENE